MEIGIHSFAAMLPDANTGRVPSPAERLAALVDEIVVADRAGISSFGVGEHHRPEYADASPAVILATAAGRPRNIRLTSAVSVLGTADPVRLFQDFATLDLVSQGRAEIIVGRGSFAEAFPLFGFERADYDALFNEKLELLLALRTRTHVHWSGRFRPALTGQGVYPRPLQPVLPIWLGVGGTPASFARAGRLGLPLMIAIIGGTFERFVPLVRLYREAGHRAGHPPEQLRLGLHVMGFLGDTMEAAKAGIFPGWLYAFTEVGRERGWAVPTRAQFDAACGPDGPYLVGDPDTVITKIREADRIFGGVARLSFQMSAANAGPAVMRRAIELIGSEVLPAA